jgi:DNA-binding transcriptional regulator YdaS (Cro superfamily)
LNEIYSINYLFDNLIYTNKLANDAALARELGVFPPTICRMRKEQTQIGATLLIAIHERFDIPVAKIREMAGMPKYERPEAGARVQFKRTRAAR